MPATDRRREADRLASELVVVAPVPGRLGRFYGWWHILVDGRNIHSLVWGTRARAERSARRLREPIAKCIRRALSPTKPRKKRKVKRG